MTQVDVGIGIVGSGYMGRTYAECVARYNSHAQLVAIAGGSRAPSLAADFGVDVEALLGRTDIVAPQSAHCEHTAAAAAEHGKHVPGQTADGDVGLVAVAMVEAGSRSSASGQAITLA